jgi:hypothetical protein
MIAEFAPRTRHAAARVAAGEVARAAGASLGAAALFWSPLCLGGALRAEDWSSHHFHYFDWVRTAIVGYRTLPLYMADAWVTPNFLANAESPSLGPLVWLLALLPTDAYIKVLLVAHTAVGLLGAGLLLRDLGVGRLPSALVAASFAFGGFFVSHLAMGHHWAMGGAWLPLLLLLFRRAAQGSDAALVGAGAVDAAALLSGQHQPFVWQNLLLGAFAALWALRARALFPLARLALVALVAAGLGAVKLLPMLAEFSGYAPTARIVALPPSLLLATLAGPGQEPGMAPASLRYAHGAGWWEYAFYLGAPALACLAAGLAAARGVWTLVVPGLFFLALSLQWGEGSGASGPWRLVQDLPIWRTQRSPSRFLFPALFCLAVAAGPGLERLWQAARARFGRGAAVAGGLLLLAVAGDLFRASLPWQRAAVGEPIAPRDHRPHPLVVRGPGAALARLAEFAPNRLVYAVEAERAARVALPLRFGPRGAEWDAAPFAPVEQDGKVAIEVPAGAHQVALRYRPPLLRAGLGASAATAALLLGAALRRARARAVARRARAVARRARAVAR